MNNTETLNNKVNQILNRLLGISVLPIYCDQCKEAVATHDGPEVFELKKMEFFTRPDIHLPAIEAEIARARQLWRAGCPGMGMLEEAQLERYIDSLLALKTALKRPEGERHTAVWYRSQSHKRMQYTLEVFDHASKRLRCTSYTCEL